MCRDEREKIQLRVWVRLDEVINLVSACKRGCDASMQMSNVEMRSILSIVERELKGIIEEIDRDMVCS